MDGNCVGSFRPVLPNHSSRVMVHSPEITDVSQAQTPFFWGVDVGGTGIKIGLVDDKGQTLAYEQIPTRESEGPLAAVQRIADVTQRIEQELGIAREVHRVGLGAPGPMDLPRGYLVAPPQLPTWWDFPIRDAVSEALQRPVSFLNDANAAAYGEFMAGAARGSTNAVVLTLGTGIGAGLILSGRIYRGTGFAGEVGHTTIDRDGAKCLCGNTGCLVGLANAASVVRYARSIIDSGRESALSAGESGATLTAEAVANAAAAGDAVAVEALGETGRALGAGLANLTLILDPDVIVIGGGVAAAGEPLLTPAREEMARRCYCGDASLPRVVPAELGSTAGVVGAALLARDELLSR